MTHSRPHRTNGLYSLHEPFTNLNPALSNSSNDPVNASATAIGRKLNHRRLYQLASTSNRILPETFQDLPHIHRRCYRPTPPSGNAYR